jgi:hypothetical protein
VHEGVLQGLAAAYVVQRAEASTRPLAMTATWSHSCSTSAMTWLEKMTEPPPRTNRWRMVRMVAADTGSTASKGSSSTSSFGPCSSAVARVIFLRMPVE